MRNYKIAQVSVLILMIAFGAFFVPRSYAAPTPVSLGTAGAFAVLAGSAISNTGGTTITGDVGIHPGLASSVTGFSSVTLNGQTHFGDAIALTAKNDLVAAYNSAVSQASTSTVYNDLAGQTLVSGVYTSTSSLALSGVLTLDGQGNANSLFIFKAGSTLITGSSASVVLINGAQACNVFWTVGSSATIGSSTSFVGRIIALTSVTLNTGATITGAALAKDGGVTMNANTIAVSACGATTTSSSSTSSTSSSSSTSSTGTTTSSSSTTTTSTSTTSTTSTSTTSSQTSTSSTSTQSTTSTTTTTTTTTTPPPKVTVVNVVTTTLFGHILTGNEVELWQNNAQIGDCFSSCSFNITSGQTYSIGVADHMQFQFAFYAANGMPYAMLWPNRFINFTAGTTPINLQATYYAWPVW